ncbi:biliverdin-producing heme oxygenase [Sphingosinicellaceae bacterium]|nr:biliverdin-producing heme oxygenase [Sphingosinicellaceae bacterium]
MRSGWMPATQPPTLHAFLKRETRDLHDRVETGFDLTGRVRSLDGYRGALLALHHLHGVAGAALDAVDWRGEAVDTDRMATRRGWLADDLRALGYDVPPPSSQRLDLDGPVEALGCLYVLEGSMLGGRVIYRTIGSALGIGSANGGRYFCGFGSGTAGAWSEFVTVLDTHAVAADGAAALRGARKTFALFEAPALT